MKIFHVDMNSFFASCEQSVRPECRGKPLIVCGDPRNRAGIVLAASYEAKAFGVKTTMLNHEAKRLCPEAVFVPSNFHLYAKTSRKVMALLDDFTPLKEQASIDEAFLDMTGTEALFGDSLHAAGLIQGRIRDELGLGCSIGVSTNKLLAKMASDFKKPMGITALYEADVPVKLWPMPVRELFGVGGKTAEKLQRLGILTIGDLAAAEFGLLRREFGEASARYLADSARGCGSDQLEPAGSVPCQSIGNERTYDHDLSDAQEIHRELLFLADSVGYRLRREGRQVRCVTLKIKYADFKVVTRAKTLPVPIEATDDICRAAAALFDANWAHKPVRLLGVTVSGFDDMQQLSLFADTAAEKKNSVDSSVDRLREKYGYNSIGRCSLLGKENGKL